MLAFLRALLLLPVALILILLAVANRAPVTMSFDPFSRGAPELGVTAPLAVFLFAALLLGVLLGGFGSWLAAGRRRRAGRRSEREVNRLKAESDRLRAAVAANRTGLPAPRA